MKNDFENMLNFEKNAFEKLIKVFEEGDKEISQTINGRKEEAENKLKMILFKQNVEQFVGLSGKIIGPFSAGELANIDSSVADILVSDGKANFVDE